MFDRHGPNRPQLVPSARYSPATLNELRRIREGVMSRERLTPSERREFVDAVRIILAYLDLDAQLEGGDE